MEQTPKIKHIPDGSPLAKPDLDTDTLRRQFVKGELILGGQIISPTAVLIDERTPEGELDFRPARERGLLSAIVRAANETRTRSDDGGTREMSLDEIASNIQEIVTAGLALELDSAEIIDTLRTQGVSFDSIVTTRVDQDDPKGEKHPLVTRQINIMRVSKPHSPPEPPLAPPNPDVYI